MKIFVWLRRNRTTINGILITVLTSLIFNTISDAEGNIFTDFREIIKHLFALDTLSGLIMAASLILLIAFNIAFAIIKNHLNKQSLYRAFPEIMKKYTSPQIAESVDNGCLSWGEGKTLEVCNDIIYGWNPENIIIETYDNEKYKFYPKEEQNRKFGCKSYYFNEKDYCDFMKSPAFQDVIRKGNNLPRFMLKQCSKNYDKNNRKLLLSFGRTEWSQTSYVWDRFGKLAGSELNSNNLMAEYSLDVKSGNNTAPYLPNSFCLHLLIETLDNKVVLSLISESKRNDNPGTWAATLGEQLELEDFTDGNNYHENFVINWVRRAFREEYKLDESMYADLVDESSIKCLSVNFESDRYNFALLCTVQLRYTFEAFYEKIKVLLSTEEASKLKALNIDDIVDILVTYNDEERRKEYHPSTYLRLLVFLTHKYGYSRTERMLIDKDKEMNY